jgi:hypothetical protein
VIKFSACPSRFPQFIVLGSSSFITSVAEQLAWLTSVIRCPIYGQLSISEIDFYQTGPTTFKIKALEMRAVQEGKGSCWTPLFLNSVLAADFPIRPRNWGLGVELTFEMMARLAGIYYNVKHKGDIYLRGSSTLLFPTATSTSSVQ